jgi:serine protease Do
VNSAIISPSGASVGIGFAVPSSTVKPIVAQILEYGETRRGWIGVRIQTVTPEIAESLGLGSSRGAMIAGLTDDGPAAQAGLEPGDVVLAFDGRNIATMRDLPRVVAEAKIGSTVDVQIFRDGETLTRKITVAQLQEESAAEAAPAEEKPELAETVVLGLGLASLNDDLRRRFNVAEGLSGVIVIEVDPLSAAAERGVQPGDVIVQVAQRAVASPEDVKRIVESEEKAGRKSVLLRLVAGGETRFVALRLGGRP